MINTEDPLAYELLSMLIDEFEKAALDAGDREAFMVLANGPLTGMETALDGQEQVLTTVQESRKGIADDDGGERKRTPKEIMEESGIDIDVDLIEVFGAEDDPTVEYLERCLGCNLRLSFDWQLKPLSLLGPINAFLDTINEALDMFKKRLDPFDLLKEICFLLNNLKGLCPADLVMILLSLKMLLKKYILQLFSIKFDWTILIGPLLKFIVDALTSLLEQIAQVILAPIDCVLTGLRSANTLLHTLNDFLGTAKGFGEAVGRGVAHPKETFGKAVEGTDGDLTYRDTKWVKPEDGVDRNGVPDPGRLSADDRTGKEEPKDKDSFPLFTGFELKGDLTMADALSDPLFPNATFLEKLIVPVQEARNWIRELFDNLIQALRSLNGLVGAGLKLNLDFMGILIFIADMVALMMMIIRLLKTNINIKDWCSHLQENPEMMEQILRGRYGEDLSVESLGDGRSPDTSGLLLRQGPDIVGKIETCSSARSENDSQIISQWIADLKV